MTAPRILVGVAGWDYPDWVGPVYPAASRRIDRLAFIARFVDLIEINSTFYRPNAPAVAESWLRRTERRERFRFAAKAHRSWTHDPSPDLDAAVPPTLEGLRPLLLAGRLSALLVQFPQSFHHRPESLARLGRILDRTRDWPVAVEVRHDSWDTGAAEGWLRARGAAWCVVDQPPAGPRVAPPRPRVTARLAYLRLHGRNRANWFRPGAGRDARYDYLYSPEELGPLAETGRRLLDEAEELIVVQNNHFRGQALVNALQMKQLLQGGRPTAPAALADRYPAVADFAELQRNGLF